MTIDVTTTGLVASVKRRGFLPSGSGLGSEEILLYATEELRSYITAFLKGIREEFIVSTLDVAVTNGTVAAPARAVGAALRTIGWVLADGRVRPLTRIEPENAGGYAGQTGEPAGYQFSGNDLVLLPAPTTGTLRLTYQQRPGQLVLPSACAMFDELDDYQNAIIEGSIPSTFAAGVLVDMVGAAPNFALKAMDREIQAVSATTITMVDVGATETLPGLEAGDFFCLAGETCIPQVPTEVHDLLAQATAYAIANAAGSARAPAIKSKLDSLEKQMAQILSPRSDGSVRVIVSKSRIGTWNGW